MDFDGLWAGVGGDRPERPVLRVDVDAIYGHASFGRKIAGGFLRHCRSPPHRDEI